MKKIIPFLTICITSLVLVKTVVAGDLISDMKNVENNKITNTQLSQMNLYLDPNTISTKSWQISTSSAQSY